MAQTTSTGLTIPQIVGYPQSFPLHYITSRGCFLFYLTERSFSGFNMRFIDWPDHEMMMAFQLTDWSVTESINRRSARIKSHGLSIHKRGRVHLFMDELVGIRRWIPT